MAQITTTHGLMDDADPRLEKRTGTDENDDEKADWIEYWMGEDLVHRSVHLHLKKPLPPITCDIGAF